MNNRDNNTGLVKPQKSLESKEGITRKEAIKRMGKYAAVTAIGSYIILNPQKAQASSAGFGNPSGGTGTFD